MLNLNLSRPHSALNYLTPIEFVRKTVPCANDLSPINCPKKGGLYTGVPKHNLIREDASKSALLEEFLHGTQRKLGIIDRLTPQGAEIQVEDFILRHASMLGLNNPADIQMLQQLKIEETERLCLIQRGLTR